MLEQVQTTTTTKDYEPIKTTTKDYAKDKEMNFDELEFGRGEERLTGTQEAREKRRK